MTDKVKGFTVTLNHDIRDDDFKRIKDAVEMIVGVQHVEPSLVTSQDHINRQVVRNELMNKLFNVLNLIDET